MCTNPSRKKKRSSKRATNNKVFMAVFFLGLPWPKGPQSWRHYGHGQPQPEHTVNQPPYGQPRKFWQARTWRQLRNAHFWAVSVHCMLLFDLSLFKLRIFHASWLMVTVPWHLPATARILHFFFFAANRAPLVIRVVLKWMEETKTFAYV